MGKFRALERARLTNEWSLEEVSALAHFLTERKVIDGDPVFSKQSKDRGLYFIETGLVRLQYEGLNMDLKEGDSFGELSLFEENHKPLSAAAAQATTLWVLTIDQFMEMKATTPPIAVKLMEAICVKIARSLSIFALPPRLLTGSNFANPSQVRPNL